MTKIKNRYDLLKLETYCKENNIKLLKDYKNTKIIRETIIEAICLTPNCNNIVNKTFRRFIDNGGCYCLKCVKKNSYYKIKNTSLKKYGVEHYFMNKDIIEKRKQTCLDKYGVESVLQLKDVIKKYRETNLKKYGFEYPIQSKKIKEKRKQTNLQNYGVEYSLQRKEVIEKRKKTTLEKYGVEHALQNPDIANKASNTSYTSKLYKLPSGKEIRCQGYEPFALDELLKVEKESNIVTGCGNVPKIWYNDEAGKKHRHYVDIYIQDQNKCIEVKSTWTFEKQKNEVLLKQKASKELGYKYEIWIYNGKGEKIECLK